MKIFYYFQRELLLGGVVKREKRIIFVCRRFRRAQNSNWKRIKPSTGESKREREAQESRGDLVVAAGIAAFWEMEQGAKPELEAEGEEVEI